MNSTSERNSIVNQVIDKTVGVVANALIYQAEFGTKRSGLPFISECGFPI